MKHLNDVAASYLFLRQTKVRLYLDLARLNKMLIRPVHRGLTLHNILPRVVGKKYLRLIIVNLGNHNLKLDEK